MALDVTAIRVATQSRRYPSERPLNMQSASQKPPHLFVARYITLNRQREAAGKDSMHQGANALFRDALFTSKY